MTRTTRVAARTTAAAAFVVLGVPASAASAGWHLLGVTPRPSARQSAAACSDPRTGSVLLFGGYANADASQPGGPLAETWTFHGGRWTRLHPRHSPTPRGDASCAWDGVELVLFGGNRDAGSGHTFGDTWVWRDGDWLLQHPRNSPGPRAGSALGYDGAALVLFGGWNPFTSPRADGAFGDTWTYRQGQWTQEVDAVAPTPRSGSASATWGRHGLLLFGGGAQLSLNDTWLHANGHWKQLQPGGGDVQPTLDGAAPLGADVLLYTGGSRTPTWRWHDGSWHAVAGAQPPQLFSAAIAALGDSSVLMFGGTHDGHTVASTYAFVATVARALASPSPQSPTPVQHPSTATAGVSPTTTSSPSASSTTSGPTPRGVPPRDPSILLTGGGHGGLARPLATAAALVVMVLTALALVVHRRTHRR